LAVEVPASTVTELGIDEMAELPPTTVNVTGVSVGAAAARVTVPVLLAPPITEAGENFSELGI